MGPASSKNAPKSSSQAKFKPGARLSYCRRLARLRAAIRKPRGYFGELAPLFASADKPGATRRHSFASVGAGGGLSLPIIGRLLGHS
jgi:hypothetical protein